LSNRRTIPDVLMLQFSFGLIFGGAATGSVLAGLGGAERLVGEQVAIGYQRNPSLIFEYSGGWFFLVLGSVFVATLFELVLVGLGSYFSPSPLTPRLRPFWLFVVGAVAGCSCTFASWLTIDLRPHPELPFYQGPSPRVCSFLVLVCVIAPFVLLKRAAPSLTGPKVDSATSRRDQSH
jgi:hypothetical protein